MRTVLCYGDSNTWGCIPLPAPGVPRRYAPAERWPGVLREVLGEGWWVVEEGMSGRTTVWDDPLEPHRDGRELLLPVLLTHQPVDLVVLMLGTNDLKHRFGAEPRDIAAGAGLLLDLIASSRCGPDGSPPRALLVCPPPLARLTQFAEEFAGATGKSRALAAQYAAAADARGVEFVDAGAHVASSAVDGIHLDAEAHRELGLQLAERVRARFGESA